MTHFDDWLYLATIEELRNRAQSADRYDQLMIAHLLRKLIMDKGKSLLTKANRERHLKLRFRVPTYELKPVTKNADDHYDITILCFASDTDWSGEATATLDQFLASPVGEFEGELVSAGDLVRHFAYVEGGVHAGKPDTRFEVALRASLDVRMTMALTWVSTLKPLAQSILDGLSELTLQIENEFTPHSSNAKPLSISYTSSSPGPVHLDWEGIPDLPIEGTQP